MHQKSNYRTPACVVVRTFWKSSNFMRQHSQYPGLVVSSRLGNFIVFVLLLFRSSLRSGMAEGGPISPLYSFSFSFCPVLFPKPTLRDVKTCCCSRSRRAWGICKVPRTERPDVEVVPVVDVIAILFPDAAM